ncbi:MAG TPA: hypothetical protein VHK28_09165 [Candidatus Limnocylindria bacterium]|nr:hypothetical protein [Candidatus Limnocylindria bacterium]
MALHTPVYRLVGRRARLERIATALGDPLIEELPIPLAISSYDLTTGQATAIVSGRLVDAVERSIAVPLFFPPCRHGDGVWCDAGPWESVPVSLARRLSPEPVIGSWVDIPKPGFLTRRPVAALLHRAALQLGRAASPGRLTARSYLALLAERYAEPVHFEEPELLVRPRLGLTPAWQFTRVRHMAAIGYRDTQLALADAGLAGPAEASVQDRGERRAA